MTRTTKTPTNTIEAAANPVPTLTPEKLAELINEVTALRAAVAKAETTKLSVAGKSEQSIKNEIAAVRAFKRLGITAKPNFDTFTFNRWISKGMRPKEGSKSVRVANLRLFHVSQCRKLTADELAAQTEQPKAAEARKGKGPKVVPIHGEANPPQ
jgi:hypothetical protein